MMEEGLVGLISSHFMDPERETATRVAGEEEEEFYDFLPFQKEFLIPLRDRAFSWDVSFEDELHAAEGEGQAISVISEQQDSHRLVIKAKAVAANRRQAEIKESETAAASAAATADQNAKKGKAGTATKKKEPTGLTSPTLQAGKANLKQNTAQSNGNGTSSSGSNGKPPVKSATAKATATGAKAATTAKKMFGGVPPSPSTEHLDSQTLRNTLSNAKSVAEPADFSQAFVKSEFGDAALNFGFGNEFDAVVGGRNVAFDDGLNIHFKADEDFPGLHEDAFGDDFRPPRKLSWSIDFNAIEAAMDSEGGYGGSGSYLYDGPTGEGAASGSFPSLLRSSEATGSTGAHPEVASSSNQGTGHAVMSRPGTQPAGITTTASRYLSSLSSSMNGNNNGGDMHGTSSSMGGQTSSSMLPSNTSKATERDQLASLMSGSGHSHAHSHGSSSSGLSLSGGNYTSTSHSHSGGLSSSSGALLGGDSALSSSGAVGGLTLGGLTVPNDGEYRVGAYTKLERHLKIEAFREKKRTRIWRKQIKYDCRKRLADTRPRVKGRFVSRKGEKGGPSEGGDDGDAGPGDVIDGGPDGAPQRLQHPPPPPQSNAPQGMLGGNVHAPHGQNNAHHQHHHIHHPSHLPGHVGHGGQPGHMASGMLKHPGGGYVGPHNTGDAHHGGVGSSIHGIKTEMKYSGSAHPMPGHLQSHGHGHHVPGGHHPANHALPPIPQSIYTPGAIGTAGTGAHHPGVGNRPMGQMGNNVQHQTHYTPAPAHNLLSQSQQQKMQGHAGAPLHHSHPAPPNLSAHASTAVNSVPTGLLLSGPSSALLHSTANSSGHGVAALPSVSTAPAVSTPMSLPSSAGALTSTNSSTAGGAPSSNGGAPAPAPLPVPPVKST